MDAKTKMELRAQLAAKQMQIQVLMGKRLQNLSTTGLIAVIKKYVEEWGEADDEGDPITQQDDELNTLLREYHEMKKQLEMG